MTKHKDATHLQGAEIDCSAQPGARWPETNSTIHMLQGRTEELQSFNRQLAVQEPNWNLLWTMSAPVTVAFSSVIWLYCNHGLKYALFVYRVQKRVYCEKLMLIWILETRVQNQKSTLYCQLTKVKEIQSFMRKLIQISRSLLREHWTPTK